MPQAWVYDINDDILPSGHWTKNPPDPIEGSYDDYFHQNLSHNILSNLFDQKDFNWYYTSKVNVVARHFKQQFATIPTSEKDRKRLTNLMPNDVTYAQHILERIALLPASANTDVKDLYLVDKYKPELDAIVDLFELLQLKIRWICIPFVTLRSDIIMGDPNVFRPSNTDLIMHLDGDGGMTQNGVRSLDYQGFLKWGLSDGKNKKGRNYAFAKRFFDNATPGERARGIRLTTLKEGTEEFSVSSNILAAKVIPVPDLPQGGGNGYRCNTSTGQCEPGLATEYCIKSSCP